jgi:hypothetical protein
MTEPDPVRDPAPADLRPNLRAAAVAGPPVIVVRGALANGAWLLRTTAVTAFLAAVAGVLVAPGLRGLARDQMVDAWTRIGGTLAYFLTGLLVTLIVTAAYGLTTAARSTSVWKGLGAASAGLVVTLAAPAILNPLPQTVSVVLAFVTSFAVFAGALQGLRASHTRAVAAMMMSLAFAGLLRVIAWNLAHIAGEHGSTQMYGTARAVATVAVAFEGLGQMIAAAWLGTRSRFGGQVLSSIAVGVAWILTFWARQGAGVSANPWAAAAHVALATASGLPQPYLWGGLVVFLLASSILLAGVAAVQGRQLAPVVAALSLSLIGRGAFDIPLHALAAAAAALWLTVAANDERLMWQSLLATRGPSAGARASGASPEAS